MSKKQGDQGEGYHEVFADGDLAAAIVDRLLERGRLILLDGPSMRSRLLALDHETASVPPVEPDRISGNYRPDFPEPTTPDTNRIENKIRPFVVGRNAWQFSGSPRGAKASATLYSLIETAKANHLEPHRYLVRVIEQAPTASTAEDYRALLPQFIDLNHD